MNNKAIKLINIINKVSTLLIESGNETYLVENMINDLIISFNYNDPNVFATSTGIFYSFKDNKNVYSDIIRIKKRGINLNTIDVVNKIVNKLINHEIDIDTAIKLCNENNQNNKNFIKSCITAGLSTSCFTVLYGGNYFDFIISFICGFFIQFITMSFKRIDIFHFLNSFIGAFVTTIISTTVISIFNYGNLDKIVIGSIMLILPGLSLTNAIKDILTGNLVSGSAKMTEAILIAISISLGVGIVIKYFNMGGSI